jgi:hypothetical protein
MFLVRYEHHLIYTKSKAIFVIVRRGLWNCEMLRISHFQDRRLKDGGKFVSPVRRPPLYSPET